MRKTHNQHFKQIRRTSAPPRLNGRYKEMRILKILFLCILFSGCTKEASESVMFYDSKIEAAFEKELTVNNIPFHKNGNQFHYSIKYRDQVNAISDKVLHSGPSTHLFVFQKIELFENTKKALDNAGIKYQVVERDDGMGISWNENESKVVKAIIREATGIPL